MTEIYSPHEWPCEDQRANLRLLVAGLKRLPKGYRDLRMGRFAKDEGIAAQATPESPCGTSACIVGHGPSFGVPIDWGRQNFFTYSIEKFCPDSDVWTFLFHPEWPDSVAEAIGRLELVISGVHPERDGDDDGNTFDFEKSYAWVGA